MADDNIFHATIKAVDQATGPMRAIAQHMGWLGTVAQGVGGHVAGMGHVLKTAFGEAEHEGHHAAHEAAAGAAHAARAIHGAGEEAKKTGHALHAMGEEAKHAGAHIQHAAHPHGYEVLAGHINLLRGHFGALSVNAGELGHSLSEFLPALAGLGAAGGLVGLFEMTEHAAESYSELNKMAVAAGVTATQFNELAFAAKQTDVPVESMNTGLFRLNRVIGDSVAGKNKDAAALFHHLGISLRDANGHLRSAADLMPVLADAFQHTTDPAMRARMAMALFGRAGKDLLPLLAQGSEELQKLSAEAAKVTFVPSGEEAEQLEEYHRSINTITAAVGGFAMEIGTKLAPVLQPVITMATEWIVANRDWIATGIADHVQELATWIGKLNLHEIIDQTTDWIKWTGHLVNDLGGMPTVLGAIALAVGSPLISGITGAIGAFGALGRVMQGMAVLMAANPVLVFAAGIGIAAYEIYQHWDWIKATAESAWTAMQPTLAAMAHAVQPLIDSWRPVSAFFADLWHDISGVFTSAWASIQPIMDGLSGAVRTLENGWVARHLGLGDQPAPNAGGPRAALGRSLYREGGPVVAGAGPDAGAPASGTVKTEITINGLPPGSTVQSRSSGIAAPPDVDVGYALAGMAAAY